MVGMQLWWEHAVDEEACSVRFSESWVELLLPTQDSMEPRTSSHGGEVPNVIIFLDVLAGRLSEEVPPANIDARQGDDLLYDQAYGRTVERDSLEEEAVPLPLADVNVER